MKHEEQKQALIAEGEKLGLNLPELKVLSTDPYFVGTERDYRDAQWAAELWDKMMQKRRKPLHIRGFHYWIMSNRVKKPDGKFYTEPDPEKDWIFLLHACQVARYLGIGKWQNLVDLKHPEPKDYDNYWVGSGLERDGKVDVQGELNSKLEGLVQECLRELLAMSPHYYTEGYQMYHLELWCEKNSMSFVLEPPCRRYGACYQPLVGQASVEKVNMSAERAIKAAQAGKKVRIFYISDWDRYGWSMVSAVARKLEFFTRNNPGVDIKLTRLALSEEQITKFNLPKAPKHGEAVVELDALEAIYPGELGKIVENTLKLYYDFNKPKIVEEENRRIRKEVEQLLDENLRKPLEQAFSKLNITGIAKGITLTKVIDKSFQPPKPGYEVKEPEKWVYNSTLDYWRQLAEYKKYKASRKEQSVE